MRLFGEEHQPMPPPLTLHSTDMVLKKKRLHKRLSRAQYIKNGRIHCFFKLLINDLFLFNLHAFVNTPQIIRKRF